MQIKQLTLCNFKSFVGEHSFGPFGRFVAIRGFNGNGKSNWFDALAFVLGESKRNLRIKFINELVHSDHQLERSYVRLVVNNGDGQDIEFQRELVQGRIVNTVDQSLVTKLEYLGRLEELRISLINQGMVLRLENLLVVAESSTKELYKLLEPFAGCDTSSDECQRLSDDLAQRQSEIQKVEQQLNNAKRRQKVLRMKKKVSDKNKKNEDEFQLFSQKLALLRLYTIDQKKEDLEKREREYFIPALDVADNIVDQLNRDLETEKSAAEQLKLEIRVNRDEREAKSNELLQRQVQIKHTEKCLKVLQCNLSAKKADLTFQRDRLDKCERCKIEFQAQKIQLEKEIDAKQAEIDGLPTDSLSQDETFLSEYCRLNDQFERNTKKLATECDQLKEQLETVQQVIFVRNESFKSLDCKKEKCEQELSKMMKVRDNHVEADALLASEEQKMAKRLQEDEMKVNELTETLEQLEHDHSNLSKDLLKSKSKHVEMKKLNVISDLMDHYEGVLGRLGDLCTPANKRYRDAFFRVFGSKLSFILVDTIETAKTCIEHLTRNKLKPAYFVCCRAARNQVSLEHLRAQCLKTNAQLLVDCLLLKNESDNELRSVLCRLSKSTFLCESLQEAYEFNEKKRKFTFFFGEIVLKLFQLSNNFFIFVLQLTQSCMTEP